MASQPVAEATYDALRRFRVERVFGNPAALTSDGPTLVDVQVAALRGVGPI